MIAEITYIGHATVLITLPSKKRIIIDPWLSGNPACPEPLTNLDSVDLICLTHGHGDHVGSVLELAARSRARVCATFELAALLNKDGIPNEQLEYMNKGGTVSLPSIDDIKVSLTHAFHSSSYVAKDGTNHYAGEPCGVVISVPKGGTFYHSGDTALFGDMALIREQYAPDVAFLCVGDRYTMGPHEAARAAKLIGADVTIPVHWGTPGVGLSGRPEDFADALKGFNTEVVILQPGESREV
jgi:L-ascorbate metabolism protein UlaG (beta-lactamase superfamily)